MVKYNQNDHNMFSFTKWEIVKTVIGAIFCRPETVKVQPVRITETKGQCTENASETVIATGMYVASDNE